MLTAYLTQTQQLLQNPPAPSALYNPGDLTTYINLARGQLAGEAECIRVYATLALAVGIQQYQFSAINLGSSPPSTSGIKGVFNVRQALVQTPNGGAVWIRPRSFEWFTFFRLNNAVPGQAQPNEWSQYGQGVTGSLFVSPTPDVAYTLNIDTCCYPIPLTSDSTPEAIPYPWTDAVPFYAAWYAMMSSQRQSDADKMFERYQMLANRARQISNASVLPSIYPQSPDPVAQSRLGLQTVKGE